MNEVEVVVEELFLLDLRSGGGGEVTVEVGAVLEESRVAEELVVLHFCTALLKLLAKSGSGGRKREGDSDARRWSAFSQPIICWLPRLVCRKRNSK